VSDERSRQPAAGRCALSDESARILEAVEELRAMEKAKRKLPISTDSFHRLADEITRKSREVFRTASRQEDVGDDESTGDDTIDNVERRSSTG
jgi:hypothetical protein